MLTARACNLALDGSPPPDWIQLLPAGPAIQGADGRAWTLPDPTALITAFTARNKPLVVDWEHASEHRAPQGLDAPAAGWIDQLEARHGAIWGHVAWTPKAVQQIAAKEYRFLSPVFTYQKTDSQIVELMSAGLTNQPNLNLTALNREESPVSFSPAVCSALALPAGADEAAVLTAITVLHSAVATATNRADSPDLAKFIPRADYDAALSRAANAEQKLADLENAQRNQQIEAALERGVKAGQITPATVEFYRAGCQREGGLAAFETFLKTAPSVVSADPQVGEAPPVVVANHTVAARARAHQSRCLAAGQPISATEGIATLLELAREKRAADLLFTKSNYNASLSTTLSGTSQWSHADADPVSVLLNAADSLLVRPNLLVIGRAVWTVLRRNSKVVAAVLGKTKSGAALTAAGVLDLQAVADLFEVDTILIGEPFANTAKPGQTASYSRLWGKHAALLRIDPAVRTTTMALPTFGFTAQFGSRVAGHIPDPKRGLHGGQTVRVGESVKELISWQEAGYFWENAVA